MKKFLTDQYKYTNALQISHNYLDRQFADYADIFKKLEQLVKQGDYTLGVSVDRFEKNFARLIGVKHAIGVGSGTDALFLSLKVLGIKEGDEVITTPFTFYATIGAIVTAGARPVFVDVGDDFNINPDNIEGAITNKTKAILPVHWSGKICQMEKIKSIANAHNLYIVEDACHAINATYNGQYAGNFGHLGCFSMHPLKNLNCWGDGGVIVTNDDDLNHQLRLLRNHGLAGRDICEIFAYNSRLDTLQAIVADHLLEKIDMITDARICNSKKMDDLLADVHEVTIPPRDIDTTKQVYHIYSVMVKDRNNLQKFLEKNGVDAKAHYPIPMHLQPAAKAYGYKQGDFPKTELIANHTLSLPVHEFITDDNLTYMAEKIKEFYGLKG